jgi:uncharacterized protein YndB with AHSA1/START domain
MRGSAGSSTSPIGATARTLSTWGEYLEIERPRRVVFKFLVPKYTQIWTQVTVEIVPLASDCELTLTHEGVLPEYRERGENGWTMLLGGLAGVVDSLSH